MRSHKTPCHLQGDENLARLSPDGSENLTNTPEVNQGVVITEYYDVAEVRAKANVDADRTNLKLRPSTRERACRSATLRSPSFATSNRTRRRSNGAKTALNMPMGQPRTYCDLPGYADLEANVAEFEEQLGRDPRSFSPPPRETAVRPRRRTREKSQKSSFFSRDFPQDWRPLSKGQSHGALAFMATHDGTGGKRGGKQSQKAKGKR